VLLGPNGRSQLGRRGLEREKIVGLSCGVDQNEEVIGKMFCEFLVAKMDEFKWNFEFEWTFLNFLKDRNLDIGQGFRSNEFELKVWNILKYNFKIWFEDLNQGIRKFDKTNLNSDSEFGFKEKNFWQPFRYWGWTWLRNEI
jgi:hypothetical protein